MSKAATQLVFVCQESWLRVVPPDSLLSLPAHQARALADAGDVLPLLGGHRAQLSWLLSLPPPRTPTSCPYPRLSVSHRPKGCGRSAHCCLGKVPVAGEGRASAPWGWWPGKPPGREGEALGVKAAPSSSRACRAGLGPLLSCRGDPPGEVDQRAGHLEGCGRGARPHDAELEEGVGMWPAGSALCGMVRAHSARGWGPHRRLKSDGPEGCGCRGRATSRAGGMGAGKSSCLWPQHFLGSAGRAPEAATRATWYAPSQHQAADRGPGSGLSLPGPTLGPDRWVPWQSGQLSQ